MRSNSEFSAPYPHPAGDVIMCLATLVLSPCLFVDGFCNPADGPDLSVMRVSAELEVDIGVFGLLQVIGLVVKQYAEFLRVNVFGQFSDALS